MLEKILQINIFRLNTDLSFEDKIYELLKYINDSFMNGIFIRVNKNLELDILDFISEEDSFVIYTDPSNFIKIKTVAVDGFFYVNKRYL